VEVDNYSFWNSDENHSSSVAFLVISVLFTNVCSYVLVVSPECDFIQTAGSTAQDRSSQRGLVMEGAAECVLLHRLGSGHHSRVECDSPVALSLSNGVWTKLL